MLNKPPNFLVTGTPGTGKTSICQQLIEQLNDNYVYLNIGDYVKEHNLYEDYDNERDCHILDEDALIESLNNYISRESKSLILDYHGCDLFEPEWLKGIFVLRTTNDELYKRLEARNYSASKITENLECEIFQTLLDEARESFSEEDVEIIELQNNTEADQINNITEIMNWIKSKN